MWYFMKNNFKLIYRSKVLFFLLILLPVLLIALLSDTFSNLLNVNKKLESFRAGYTCEDDSFMKPMLAQFQQVCKNNGIALTNLELEDGIKETKNGELDIYVDLKEKDYQLYKGNDTEGCSMVLDNILASFISSYQQQAIMQSKMSTTVASDEDIVAVEKLEVEPIADAKTYYGIVEILYMMWCGIISIAAINMSENKHQVRKRYYISTISSIRYYLGKLLAGVAALCIQMGAAIAITVVFMDVNWGSVFYKSAGMLFLQSIAVSSVSILLYQIFHNTAVALAIEFFGVFLAGFLGGSFQTYMYSTISEKIAVCSPQYYLNRTMVEYVTKGYSDYTYITIGILLAFTLVSGCISMLLIRKRREA